MAHGVPGFVRIGAALAGCALVAACTPDAPPTGTPLPSAPVSSTNPTPSATPTETEIERQQRLDWEAAEKAYRTSITESNRLHRLGGTEPISGTLRAVATGPYLKLESSSLGYLRKRGWKYVGGGIEIANVRRSGGWQPDQLALISCEDNSQFRVIDRNGNDVTPKNRRDYVQALTAIKQDSRWKIADVVSEEIVDAASHKECRDA